MERAEINSQIYLPNKPSRTVGRRLRPLNIDETLNDPLHHQGPSPPKQSTVARGHAIRFLRTTSHHQTMSPAMTVAPARPLLHAYSGEDPMEIIDYRGRKLERWRALAEETGRLSALVELSEQVRNDSAAIVDRQNARDAELNARQDSIADA